MVFILALMAIVVMVIWGMEWSLIYLICSMSFGIFCWLPNADILSDRAGEYEHGNERNCSNPLFVKGFFRENENELKRFSSFKYLCICQIISLLLLLGTLSYLCVMNLYRRIITLEIILTSCFFALVISWIGIKEYYKRCYKQSFQFSESAEGIWTPFSYVYRSYKLLKPFNLFSCNYFVKYEDLQKKLEKATKERGYVPSGCFKDDYVKSFHVFTRLDGEKLDIFALIHIDELEEESWEHFNNIFANFWKKDITGRHEKKQMALTFLLCVDKYSKELRKKHRGIYTVDSKQDRYRLAAMLSYSKHSSLHIWPDYEVSCGGKRGRRLRYELLEMLDLSQDYNGEQYPEDAIDDFWRY